MNKDVLAIIHEITEKSVGGRCIFRGEPEHYNDVSSKAYQIYGRHSNFELVENLILNDVKQHDRNIVNTPPEEVIALLQHYGGVTNLIDFTTDYLIALFFACNGSFDKDGRVILLSQRRYHTLVPSVPVHRVTAQKSIFVRPKGGNIKIDNDKVRVVNVPGESKLSILEHLRNYHGLRRETIYNDIHGFIMLQNQNKRAREEFNQGVLRVNSKNYMTSIQHFNKAIQLDPEHAGSWNNRGAAYFKQGDCCKAIENFKKAIELDPNHAIAWSNLGACYLRKGDLDSAINNIEKAIELEDMNTENHGDSLFNRAMYRLYTEDWPGAMSDLVQARKQRADIAELFKEDYKDISTFEADARVKLPTEISEMLA